ncbi:ABC transporter ATP-binding protein [Nonomuraea soli]|uniref:Heme ABC exporter ATP-binding subunit CcmA n=1 Tax=Nonomuraea soli TaxID=1032476 RepID=A0A7W0CJW0_9ACTN|nr:ABC transporter ATP-binding protein [Nonomuraea soli]MBA2892280.1 heme ABC exporter ATP-binding subunit CcmA [Nonomuraea soli]
MRAEIITVRHVRVDLAGHRVLDDVALSARPGQIIAITGENGAGKSTLLRCLAGLQTPTGGEIDVLHGPPADAAAFWRDVAFVADEPAWYPGLGVREHLDMVLSVHQGGRMSAEAALSAVDLAGRDERHPLTLSTGQRQRLSLAMALIRPSRVLLLDEPERGLDAAFRPRLAALLRDYAGEGGAVVMATHSLDLAEACGAVHLALEPAS